MPTNATPFNHGTVTTAPVNSLLGTMPADNGLDALKPLIEPTAINGWPPAPGWWIVGAILLGSVIALLVWGFRRWRHHRQTRYQREALALLANIQSETVAGNTTQKLHDAALILRRAIICAWGREHAATLSWEAIFRKHNPAKTGADKKSNIKIVDETSVQLLMQSLYSQHAPSPETLQILLAQISAWLVTLPPVDA